MKTITKLFIGLILVAALSFGQTALSTTTLGAAIATTNGTTITLASTSTMQSQGQGNQINTCFYVDKELFGVITVVDSTHVVVQQRGRGCGAVGASARPMLHANGAKVYFANTATNGSVTTPAASYIGKNDQPTAESYGACTATNELALPKIYIFTGEIFNCYNGSSGGQWFLNGIGTMNDAGTRIAGFCTGSLGSTETEYLNSAACSGATTLTARQVVTTAGVMANLYVVAGTAVTGGTSKDVLTVYKNGSSTTITCTFATGGAATTCSDTAHSVDVVPGDVIAFQFVTASSDSGANVGASVGLY